MYLGSGVWRGGEGIAIIYRMGFLSNHLGFVWDFGGEGKGGLWEEKIEKFFTFFKRAIL